jgi:hypothetical protein
LSAAPSWPEAAGQQCRPMKCLRNRHQWRELFAALSAGHSGAPASAFTRVFDALWAPNPE